MCYLEDLLGYFMKNSSLKFCKRTLLADCQKLPKKINRKISLLNDDAKHPSTLISFSFSETQMLDHYDLLAVLVCTHSRLPFIILIL